jgi:hypothetical protein
VDGVRLDQESRSRFPAGMKERKAKTNNGLVSARMMLFEEDFLVGA